MSEENSRRSLALVALVAEDEPLYRMLTVDLLSDAGFEVIEAVDAAEALAQFEGHAGIALLFTDIRMPGRMDGLGLAHEVTQRWPETRIIVCSAVPGIDTGAMPDGAVFFDKPYQPEHILVAVQRAMSTPTKP